MLYPNKVEVCGGNPQVQWWTPAIKGAVKFNMGTLGCGTPESAESYQLAQQTADLANMDAKTLVREWKMTFRHSQGDSGATKEARVSGLMTPRIASLLFADNVTLFASLSCDLWCTLESFYINCEVAKMRTSISKSETMVLILKMVEFKVSQGLVHK